MTQATESFDKIVVTNLMAIATAYQKATGKSLTQISKEFYGRGDFFEKFGRGEHSISVVRLSEMLTKFSAEWPEGTKLPLMRPIFFMRR